MSQSYLLVRLRPVDPYTPGRRTYTVMKRDGIPATLKFEEVKGWHKLPRSIGEVLRNEEDALGTPVFDVCTHEEAIKVEMAEEQRRSAKAVKAKASAPHSMNALVTAKSARDLVMEEPAKVAPPAPRRAPAPAAKPVAPVAVETPDTLDWGAVDEDSRHPANELQDERGEEDSEVAMETVDLSAPADAPAPSEAEAPKRGRGGKRK